MIIEGGNNNNNNNNNINNINLINSLIGRTWIVIATLIFNEQFDT
ncbi:MAG: hypothetical protein N7Q72_05015 [Spiroplasma sp. Tabriz.8]|nr:hypothetical protein [Spiroplasma sp. Tabriz.8]